MKDTPYNQLPNSINIMYGIQYSELVYFDLSIFKNSSEKWGVILQTKQAGFFTAPKFKLLIEPIYNSVGFNNELNIITAVMYENNQFNRETNTFYYFDTEGNKLWQAEKGTHVTFDKYKNIIIERKHKSGVLDKNFDVTIEPTYEQLRGLKENLFIAYHNDHYGIIDINNDVMLDFDYKKIFDITAYNKVIVQGNHDEYYSFDLEQRILTPIPFKEILGPCNNSYFISIINASENKGFENHPILKYNGDWGITDAGGEVIIPNEYKYVEALRNPNYYKVCKGALNTYYFKDENEDERQAISNVKWGIVDGHNNIIIPIEYDWIDEVEAVIWAVYKGGTVFYNDDYQENYWTNKGGKLGVYKMAKKIIPEEYDAIMLTWFKIKDFIFVQKGKDYFQDSLDYDVFTLNGKKIESNKPIPRNHINSG